MINEFIVYAFIASIGTWFITMLGMFIAGLIIPLIFIYVYRKLKRNPKFINLVVGLN